MLVFPDVLEGHRRWGVGLVGSRHEEAGMSVIHRWGWVCGQWARGWNERHPQVGVGLVGSGQ